jgi:hypothetical protein
MTDDWSAKNERRVELIRKRMSSELSSDEERELELLQTELADRLAPVDEELLRKLAAMEADANRHRRYWFKGIAKETLRCLVLFILAILCLVLAEWVKTWQI